MKPFWSLHTFQACAFDHSAISPTSLSIENLIIPNKVTKVLSIDKHISHIDTIVTKIANKSYNSKFF